MTRVETEGGGGVGRGRPVWQGVSTDSLKLHPGPPCPTLLRPEVGGPPAGGVACSRLLPPWIPHGILAWGGRSEGGVIEGVGRTAPRIMILFRHHPSNRTTISISQQAVLLPPLWGSLLRKKLCLHQQAVLLKGGVVTIVR
jgi:hypothetical protein